MNKTYRLVWNELTNSWIAVAEIVKARGKRASRALLLAGMTVAALPATTFAQPPPAPTDLPTGGQVVAGQAGIAQSGATMNITQSTARAAIDWQTFNVGSNATVNFNQPSSSAVTLNRVLSSNSSQIFGQINANGQVFLSNPGGVYFAPGASVNVGGLVATTHGITNDDFMAGNYRFTRNGTTGSVVNEGTLTAELNGYIALLAPEVRNHGVVIAQMGTVALAAGEAYELQFAGSNTLAGIQVEPTTLAALVENGNAVQAPGGLVILSARAADRLQGSVVRNSGAIEAGGLVEKGGRILLEGDHITLANGSLLDAKGATGGGEVLVGGGWQGSGSMHQATTVTMEQGATIDVSATRVGAGGTAVLWSDIHNPDSQTRAHGTIWAKGGAEGGDGGRIETSGHWLDIAGSQGGASATNGKAGEWLLDPYNVTITSVNANGLFGSADGTDTWTPNADNSTILNTDINSKLEGGTNVTVTTNGVGSSQIGDITVSSPIAKSAGATDVTLTLRAANSIIVNDTISNTGGGGRLHVTLDADNNNGTGDGAGIVLLNNDISTGGGNLQFGTGRTATIGGVSTLVGGDVYVAGTGARTLTTNGGSVNVQGEMILANTSGLTINTSNGNVRFYGLLNSGNQYSYVDGPDGQESSWDWARTNAKNSTAGGSAVGDSYLVTIMSRLENSVAVATGGYRGAWIGAYRPVYSSGNWVWADGPETGLHFFTQPTGVTTGNYANFGSGEPNGSISAGCTSSCETVGQFYGTGGQWNDLAASTVFSATQTNQYAVLGYIRETNLAASPLTVNAGSGTITFSGAVGGSKALSSLNVTAGTIAINGGAVTTEGLQTYNNNVTLGSSATTLTQTNANTDFTLQAGKSISNASDGDAGLTIKTTRNIILDSSSGISSSTGALGVALHSDSDATDGGYIALFNGSAITTNGGHLWLGGGSGSATWNGLTVGDGYTVGTAGGSNGIFLQGTTISTGGGNIAMYGKSRAGVAVGDTTGDAIFDTDSNSNGIRFATGNQNNIDPPNPAGPVAINSGTGTILLDGVSQGTGGGNWAFGIQFENLAHSVTSAATSGDAITLIGTGTTDTTTAGSSGIWFNNTGVLQATGGGNIVLTGTGGNSTNYKQDINFAAAGTISAGTGNLTVNANTLAFHADARLSGTGNLFIQPRTANTTIGIAGGTGTLALTATNFSTNFADGFSGLTIGSATAGNITIGTTALTYNDPLTLKTAGNIKLDENASMTGGVGENASLVLWADSDNNEVGNIFLDTNATITSNGGNITLGGGSDPLTDQAVGNTTSTDGDPLTVGVYVQTGAMIDAGGGDISLRGKGGTTTTHTSNNRGITVKGTVKTSGSGSISMEGTGGATDGAWGIATDGSTIQTDAGAIDMVGIGGGSTNTRGIGTFSGDIQSSSGSITLTGTGNGTGEDLRLGGTDTRIGKGALASSSSDITLIGDILSMSEAANAARIQSTGNLVIKPRTAGRTIEIGSAWSTNHLSLAAFYFAGANANIVDGFSSITVGDATAGAITVGGATTFNDSTMLQTNSTIALNGAITANENLTLTANGAITQNQAVGVTGTTSITAGGGNDITLDNADNNFGGAVSVISAQNLSLIDSNALTLGAVTATGTVNIATLTDDLTLTGTVETTNATVNAIKLNAGKSAVAGTAIGGNIIVSGGSVSVGSGGRATLYSGSVSGSTDLTTLVGSGSDRFRYNSDEAASNFTTALTAGANAIYREQPTVTVTANNESKTYDGLAYSGGNGVGYGGFVNGDTSSGLGGTLAYGGTSQSATNAGTFAITPSGLTSGLGYALTFADGTLTISPAALTVTADNASKSYGQTVTFAGTEFTSTGLQNDESIGSVSLASDGATATAGVSGSPYAITASNATGGTFSTGNYTISYANGSLTIEPVSPPPPPPVAPIAPLPVPETSPPLPVLSASVLESGSTISAPSAITATASAISVDLVQAPSVQQVGIIFVSVPKEMATAGAGFSFPLPAQVTADAPPDAPVQVTLLNGDPLPAWLRFIPETNSFIAAAVPDGAFPIQLTVTVGGRSSTVVISERTE